MEYVKKAAVVLISGLFLAQTASAASLTISNDTGYEMAFTINGVCSSVIGKVSDFKFLSEADFEKACGKSKGCAVEAYYKTCYSTYLGGVVYNGNEQTIAVLQGNASCVGTKGSLESGGLNLNFYRRGWSCI